MCLSTSMQPINEGLQQSDMDKPGLPHIHRGTYGSRHGLEWQPPPQ
jgi:hypothetical protein